MTMEQQPFEDISPIGNTEFPASHVYFYGGYLQLYRIYVWKCQAIVWKPSNVPRTCALATMGLQSLVQLVPWCKCKLMEFQSRWIPWIYVKNRDGKPFKGLVLAILVVIICNYREKNIWTWYCLSEGVPNLVTFLCLHFFCNPFFGATTLIQNKGLTFMYSWQQLDFNMFHSKGVSAWLRIRAAQSLISPANPNGNSVDFPWRCRPAISEGLLASETNMWGCQRDGSSVD